MIVPKIKIGSDYRPHRFETRDRDGNYSCLRPTQSATGDRIQMMLLGTRIRLFSRDRILDLMYWAVGAGLLAWLLLMVFFAR